MKVEFKSDFPVNDAACREATGRTLKEWFKELDARGGAGQKRRDAIHWLYGAMNKNAWWSTTAWVEYERARGVVNKKDGRIEGYNICVTKTIAAPVAEVYAAWSAEAPLRKWFGAQVRASVVDGGTVQDGAGNSGEFLRVRKDKDLRFSWNSGAAEAPTQVDVAFADKGKGKTGITLNHVRIQNRAEADGLRAAWSDSLDALKNQLEA